MVYLTWKGNTPTGGKIYLQLEMQIKTKTNVKTVKQMLQVHRYSSSAQKTKFEDFQTEVGVGVEGCLGHPQAYGLNHSWMNLDLV